MAAVARPVGRPGSDGRVRGVASLIGAAALAAGIMTLLQASGAWLGVLVGTTALLWAIATIHHMLLARRAGTGEKLRSSPRVPRRHVTV